MERHLFWLSKHDSTGTSLFLLFAWRSLIVILNKYWTVLFSCQIIASYHPNKFKHKCFKITKCINTLYVVWDFKNCSLSYYLSTVITNYLFSFTIARYINRVGGVMVSVLASGVIRSWVWVQIGSNQRL
jgi:hypothetical protein